MDINPNEVFIQACKRRNTRIAEYLSEKCEKYQYHRGIGYIIGDPAMINMPEFDVPIFCIMPVICFIDQAPDREFIKNAISSI